MKLCSLKDNPEYCLTIDNHLVCHVEHVPNHEYIEIASIHPVATREQEELKMIDFVFEAERYIRRRYRTGIIDDGLQQVELAKEYIRKNFSKEAKLYFIAKGGIL